MVYGMSEVCSTKHCERPGSISDTCKYIGINIYGIKQKRRVLLFRKKIIIRIVF